MMNDKILLEAKQKKYKKRVWLALRRLYSTFRGRAQDIQTLDAFVNTFQPTGLDMAFDAGRLPYYNRGKNTARKKSKRECVYALISYMITQYWRWYEKHDNEKKLLDAIKDVEKFSELGYEGYTVQGSPETGYSLKCLIKNNE